MLCNVHYLHNAKKNTDNDQSSSLGKDSEVSSPSRNESLPIYSDSDFDNGVTEEVFSPEKFEDNSRKFKKITTDFFTKGRDLSLKEYDSLRNLILSNPDLTEHMIFNGAAECFDQLVIENSSKDIAMDIIDKHPERFEKKPLFDATTAYLLSEAVSYAGNAISQLKRHGISPNTIPQWIIQKTSIATNFFSHHQEINSLFGEKFNSKNIVFSLEEMGYRENLRTRLERMEELLKKSESVDLFNGQTYQILLLENLHIQIEVVKGIDGILTNIPLNKVASIFLHKHLDTNF